MTEYAAGVPMWIDVPVPICCQKTRAFYSVLRWILRLGRRKNGRVYHIPADGQVLSFPAVGRHWAESASGMEPCQDDRCRRDRPKVKDAGGEVVMGPWK